VTPAVPARVVRRAQQKPTDRRRTQATAGGFQCLSHNLDVSHSFPSQEGCVRILGSFLNNPVQRAQQEQ
jgi:hypothetical protein